MKPAKALKGTTISKKNTPVNPPPAKAPVTVVQSKPAPPVATPVEAPKKAAATAAAPEPVKKTGGTATIEAKVDVGFGNTLYIRGEGKGLDWDHGVPLKCIDGSTWQWSGVAEDKLKFKLLINDAIWAKGEDLVIAPGQKLQVSPSF